MNLEPELFPTFLKLAGRRAVVVGGGTVAAAKLPGLMAAGAAVTVVAPEISPEIAGAPVTVVRRRFAPDDLDGAWFVVAAATPEANRAVAAAAEARGLFVNAVDDPANASAYAGGVFRRAGITVAISTDGKAPALAGLLREGLEAILPEELEAWNAEAQRIRQQWKSQGTPLGARRPLLLMALNRLYEQRARESRAAALATTAGAAGRAQKDRMRGFVSLVGAGPGDPDLLTRKAARRLREADLVLYDDLVSPEILRLARRAQCFSVGKRAGAKAIRQETIHEVMIRAARRNKRVVRLKGGDPFVLGRGGEEALALAASGVPFEVVPGVTTAIAAPGLAGVPLTHRGISSSFMVVSGHAESAYRPLLEALPPHSTTIVVLMGLQSRARLATLLIERGWRPATPVAVLLSASTPRAATWFGTLGSLADAPVEPASRVPGTIAIGDVVSLSSVITLAAGARLEARVERQVARDEPTDRRKRGRR